MYKVLNNSKDENEINNVLQNLKFYKDILTQKSKIIMDDTIVSNINNEDTKLTSSSSCLIPNSNNDGYIMNIRYVNYYIDGGGGYLNCDKHIITVNKYVELDKNFNKTLEKCINLDFDNRRYIGVEDVRIFNDVNSGELLFIGTGYHHNNKIGIVSGKYDTTQYNLKSNEITTNFNNSDCEKNWVFVDYNDLTHIIYKWNPLQLCKINEEKYLSIVKVSQMPSIFNKVRGSTCGFKYNKKVDEPINENTNENINENNISIDFVEPEIWFVNHIVSYENPRHYYHIISVFDADMNLLRYSAPFKFEGDPIEYCLSIVVEDEQVLINYSTWDRTTRIGVYDKKYIDSIVKYN